MPKTVKPFHIFKDAKGKYRWRVTAPNGRILAVSSEAYTRRIDCKNAALRTLAILRNDLWCNTPVVNELPLLKLAAKEFRECEADTAGTPNEEHFRRLAEMFEAAI